MIVLRQQRRGTRTVSAAFARQGRRGGDRLSAASAAWHHLAGRHLGHESLAAGRRDRPLFAGGKLPRLRQALALADRGQGLDGASTARQQRLRLAPLGVPLLRRWPVAFTRSLASLVSVLLGMA